MTLRRMFRFPPRRERITPMGPKHTTDRNDPRLGRGVDTDRTEQHDAYLVLSDDERARGFVRPLRHSYQHLVCGTVTTMSGPIAETYARDPHFYGATYCCGCQMHTAVGEHGEFVWCDEHGRPTNEKVGT